MQDPPLVTVVVPAYNVEGYIGDCLGSILAQTYPHVEIVVLDDNSTDGTPEILGRFADRLRVVRQHENLGI